MAVRWASRPSKAAGSFLRQPHVIPVSPSRADTRPMKDSSIVSIIFCMTGFTLLSAAITIALA